MTSRGDRGRPVKTTETAFELFEIVKDQGGLTLTEISDRIALSVGTVHRHLTTLCEHGYLQKRDQRYYTGMRFLEFGLHSRRRNLLFRTGKEQADKAATEIGEKVWLVTHQNGRSYHLYRGKGDQITQTAINTGSRGFLHQTAAGKAILSTLPDDEVAGIVERWGLPAATESTITDEETLFDELDDVRQQGYAFNRGESNEGFKAVGTPVQDGSDQPIGAVSISGPANRLAGPYFEEELAQKTLTLANEIEINIKYA